MRAEPTRGRGLTRRELFKGTASAGLVAGTGSFGRRARAASHQPHVVVLGAGLAGLCAAYQLQRRGCSYTILEAEQDHIGGRVRTVRFGDGLHGELGPMRIPKTHETVLNYVDSFGLACRPFVGSNDNAFYFARGHRVRIGDLAKFKKLYQLRHWENNRSPSELWTHAVIRHLDSLTAEERHDLAHSDVFKTKKISDFDRLSLRQLLELGGLSDEAIEYLLVAWGALTLQHSAATEHLREELSEIWSVGQFYEISGGAELLPKAFLDRLRVKPQMGCEVVHLEQDPAAKRATAVYRTQAGRDRVSGDFVLCTIPFPVLGRMDLPFGPEKRRAIHEVWYESATKVLIPTTKRFWEMGAQPIFGGSSYTDSLAGWIYYPSDNATDMNPEKSKGPGVLLASYNCGQDARILGAMGPDDRAEVVLRLVSKVHPELADPGIVRHHEIKSWSWDNHRWAGGAFAFYMPGQFQRMHQHVIAPEGRIFFAGEHCSRAHTWIQGALESAETAVTSMLAEWAKQ
jgi:monoamine oxidase